MTPAQVRSDIDRLISSLLKAGIAIDYTVPQIVQSHGLSVVTWSSQLEMSVLMKMVSAYDQYAETLRQRWYSVLLFDGSMLQFSYTFSGRVLKKHRLSFQPCPIYFKPSELDSIGIADLLELIDGQEFRERIRLEGPMRFDYDLDSSATDHPASHLTISRTSCRVPVMAPLSVGHFCRFLFSHFYPDQWAANSDLQAWACSTWDNCLPELEADRLFLSWKRAN